MSRGGGGAVLLVVAVLSVACAPSGSSRGGGGVPGAADANSGTDGTGGDSDAQPSDVAASGEVDEPSDATESLPDGDGPADALPPDEGGCSSLEVWSGGDASPTIDGAFTGNQLCTPGFTFCLGSTLVTCLADGCGWENTSCPDECIDDECV